MKRKSTRSAAVLPFFFVLLLSRSGADASIRHRTTMRTEDDAIQRRRLSFPALLENNKSSDNSRRLQNIVIKYPNTYGLANTEIENSNKRKNWSIACQTVDQNVQAYTTKVEVKYTADTDIEVVEVEDEEGIDGGDEAEGCYVEEIPEVVASIAVGLLAEDYLCGLGKVEVDAGVAGEDGTLEGEIEGSSGTNEGCVISVSAGEPGNSQGTCEPTAEEGSTTCNSYTDQFSILHTDECSREDVLDAAKTALREILPSTTFREEVNGQDLCAYYSVTKIAIIDDNGNTFVAAQTQIVNQGGGLTPAGKFVIFLAVAAAVLLAMLGFAWRRHRANRRRRMEDDMKSVRTDWSSPTNDSNSYLKPDFHDLALRHSNQNVHRCNSAFCRQCRPDLGLVHMTPVQRGESVENIKKKGGFQICGTVDDTPEEAFCVGAGCMSDFEEEEQELVEDHVPDQVVCPKKMKSKKYRDPLEQPPVPLPLEMEQEARVTEPQFDELPPHDEEDRQRTAASLQSYDDDEQDYSYCDDNTNNDGFTFVRIANARRADNPRNYNCAGEPSHEVAL